MHACVVLRLQVALRRRLAGKRDGVMAGETVPYVICLRLNNQQQQQQQQQQGDTSAAPAAVKQEDSSQVQQQPAAAAQDAAASPAAAPQQQQDGSSSPAPATAAASGSGVRAASAPAGGSSSSSGGLAERAYHPDELRCDPSLVVDADYYLGTQVLPVVVRLCAPIEVRTRGRVGRGRTLLLCGWMREEHVNVLLAANCIV
jgi:DNA polymerase alpha subunit A